MPINSATSAASISCGGVLRQRGCQIFFSGLLISLAPGRFLASSAFHTTSPRQRKALITAQTAGTPCPARRGGRNPMPKRFYPASAIWRENSGGKRMGQDDVIALSSAKILRLQRCK